MKPLILFTITSLLLFNNKAFPTETESSQADLTATANPRRTNSKSLIGPDLLAPTFSKSTDSIFTEPNQASEKREMDKTSVVFTNPTANPFGPDMKPSQEVCCNLFSAGTPFTKTLLDGANLWTRNGRFIDFATGDEGGR